MPVDVLLGLQWGDEGKGKVVDYLAPKYEIIARFQGGPNAGHTLVINGKKHVLHQIPSGIFHEKVLNVVGNGVVLDPIVLKKELEGLATSGLNVQSNLVFSDKAHLILPGHRHLDAASEQQKGEGKIGSTLKGIGPCYQDKYARNGLMMGQIRDAKGLSDLYDKIATRHIQLLDGYGYKSHDILGAEKELFMNACSYLKEFDIQETEYLLNKAHLEGKNILAEGAQGTLLDIEFGTYPFVTSSHTVSAGACIGLGLPPKAVRKVFGIFKAYCTRVGSGPFPTELFDETGELIRKNGFEFGSTTGRPRRCGWLDLELLNYANMLNGTDEMMMMKADVLDGFESVKVYLGKNKEGHAEMEELKGWKESKGKAKEYEDLDVELKAYVDYIEKKCKVPITMVSIGPDRTETIMR